MAEAATVQRPETAEQKAKRRKRAARPVYMEWRPMVDQQTGEVRLALVAESGIDRFLLKERGYRPGDQVRAEIKKPRNVKIHRLVHALGKLVGQSIDKFQGMDAHSAIKKLQFDAGVCCTFEAFDIPDLGRVTRRIPESLAFDEMDETRFREFWGGICQHLIAEYWHGLSEEQVEEMIDLMPQEGS
ncbi:hypothetical protein ACYCFL_05715 [Stutzerimonas nitrititolerans]|uniref:hypothetical protein n=1 Tax=Stutzerimonas nitrititolerans TaxID=2482751 RepID=UPI0028994FC2|nr:hypothetical protein [Stutzerimonas nitrititolerans]